MANIRTQQFRAKDAPSGLPSLIIPCPRCGGRLSAGSTRLRAEPIGVGLEDIAHGCERCGTELIRTVICAPQI